MTTTQYAYNGDGARLKQTVAGAVTTYTQDLAAPLPVVLQAQTGSATTQHLYALGTRPLAAAQNGGAWEYLLPDALGSVRQIVDANGNVTLAESYEPYGSVMTSTGTASSIFGYAGGTNHEQAYCCDCDCVFVLFYSRHIAKDSHGHLVGAHS